MRVEGILAREATAFFHRLSLCLARQKEQGYTVCGLVAHGSKALDVLWSIPITLSLVDECVEEDCVMPNVHAL